MDLTDKEDLPQDDLFSVSREIPDLDDGYFNSNDNIHQPQSSILQLDNQQLPIEDTLYIPEDTVYNVEDGIYSPKDFAYSLYNLSTTTSSTRPELFGNSSSHDIGLNVTINRFDEESFGSLGFRDVSLVGLFCILIVVTVIGNTLVILAVLTTRRLRTVTNCFVTSLAVADWLVGICVMPPAVALHLMGTWRLGWVLCDIWISMDVLLCTASILSLCAISVDRYLAVTQPLKYSRRRRSKRLALLMILAVWAVALAITSPPMLGWYEIERGECRYNQNPGYVVFSAMGSFFIPMVVMLYVYVRISCVVARRHQQLSSTTIKGPKRFSRWACLRAESETSESLNQASTPAPPNVTPPPPNGETNSLPNHSAHPAQPQTKAKEPPQNYELVPSRQCCYSCENIKKKKKNHRRSCSSMNRSVTNFQIQTDTEEVKLKRSATVTYKTSKVSRISIRSKQHFVNEHTVEHQNNRVSSLRRETKTAQTLSIVVGGFVACWLPFFLYYLLTPFLPRDYVKPGLMAFLTWLGWFNSAINPFIYAFYSPDFRVAFWRLTVKRCSKDSRRADFAFQHK